MNTPVFNVQAHSGLVNAIDGCGGLGIGGGAPELVTGGRDGMCCCRSYEARSQPLDAHVQGVFDCGIPVCRSLKSV